MNASENDVAQTSTGKLTAFAEIDGREREDREVKNRRGVS